MSDSGDQDKGIIAERLDRLFNTMTPEGRPYTLREAAEGINKKAGRDVVTFQYLSHLRSGLKKNPSYEKLQAIATFFGVKCEYFTDDEVARRTEEEIRILKVMRDNKVKSLAFRAATLGPEDLKLVLDMVNRLPPADSPSSADSGDAGAEPPGADGPDSGESV